MDALTLFGLFSVVSMLVCYALEDRSPNYVLGFAATCALSSLYGFLQGAWPFGVVEIFWVVVALRRWWLRVSDPKVSQRA
ncbi:MAG: hypothetical protein ACXWJU_01375 [Hyphomicrobium sp.]